MVLIHFSTELLTFRSSRLGAEIVEERNIAAGLFKAVIFLSTTLAYIHG